MSPEVLNAWIAALQTSQSLEVPEAIRAILQRQMVELLLAILTASPAEPAARRR